MQAYNSSTPPDYDLSKVTVPVALFWSDNDWLADPEDVKYLTSNLPNIVANDRIPLPKFNHIDFLWGVDADVLVYKKLVSLLMKSGSAATFESGTVADREYD
jgi:lysosomal acid lipase/cholesteryl ester hydrolase